MPQTFYAILTATGEAKDANAKALGIPLQITQMGVGDGNGNVPNPVQAQTALVHEVRRAALNSLSRDAVNLNQVIAEQVIPENEGGWWIREIGLYDADGDLIAVANCPPTYKPQLAEGSGRTQVVRMILIMSSADTVQLKVDPAVVLATRKYADDAIVASMNAHLAAQDPHPQYLTQDEVNALIVQAIADRPAIYTMATVPEIYEGDSIIVSDGDGVWNWVDNAYFTGYRHPHCGFRINGSIHATPKAWEVSAVGSNMSKTSFTGKRIWSVAQENGLVVAAGTWVAGSHWFVDNGDDTFKLCDLRNTFDRAAAGATDPDTANARTLGSYKTDSIKSHFHDDGIQGAMQLSTPHTVYSVSTGTNIQGSYSTGATGTAETAPKHTAYAPRLHV